MTFPAHDGVAVVPWPSGAAARRRARLAGVPRLLVVEPGTAPPTDCTRDEDWTTTAAPAADVAARLATLAERPRTGPGIAPAAVAGLDDDAVTLLDVLAAAWPRAVGVDARPAALADVRTALAPTGYDVLTVPGGLLLAGIGVTAAGRSRRSRRRS
jgi:hypothetical protein